MNKPTSQTMMLFTSFWRQDTTFKLMPTSTDCPFTEAIYDPKIGMLVVISKIVKDSFQYVDRLDDDGQPMRAKKPGTNGNPFKQQRVLVPMFQEYYISEKNEQIQFIKQIAVNAQDFDFEKYLRDLDAEGSSPLLKAPEQKAMLVTAEGKPLTSK